MFSVYKPVVLCKDCLCWDVTRRECMRLIDGGVSANRLKCDECDFCSHGKSHAWEMQKLHEKFPDVEAMSIPMEVWDKVLLGSSLLEEYTLWNEKMNKKDGNA